MRKEGLRNTCLPAVFLSVTISILTCFSFAAEAVAADEAVTPSPAVAEQKPAAAPEKPLKIKPFVLKSEDGLASIKFGLAVQMVYESTWTKVEDEGPHSNYITFKHIQPGISGNLFTPDFTYKFSFEMVPGKIDVVDAFVDYSFHTHAQLRLGSTYVGFTRLRMNSWTNQALVDFSIGPKYFGSERQVGLTLHNGLDKPGEHEYEFGIYTGAPSRPSYDAGLAKVSKEKMLQPMILSEDNDDIDKIHPELVGHYAYNYNGIDVTTETDWEKTNFRCSAGLGLSYDPRPEAYRDFAMRTGLELMMKAYGWSFLTTFWTGFYDKSDEYGSPEVDGNFNYAMLGLVLQSGYLIERYLEIVMRYSHVNVGSDYRKDVQARTQAILDGAADEAELAELESAYKGAGVLENDNELSLGINGYPLGKHLKLTSDVSLLWQEKVAADTKHDVRLRLLMQMTF